MAAAPPAPPPPPLVSAIDLINGNALYSPSVAANAAALLAKHHLGPATRHMATLEYESSELTVMGIAMLGSARGYDVANAPRDALMYAEMILALDTLGGQMDPGKVLCSTGGVSIAAGALVNPLRKMAREAMIESYTPMGAPAGGTGGGAGYDELVRAMDEVTNKKKEGKPKDMTSQEVNKLRDAFHKKYGWTPPRTDHGDGKAFGLVRYWMETQQGYAGKKQLDYLQIKNAKGGEKAAEGDRLVAKDGEVETQTETYDLPEPTNSTQHVQRFARKLMTILLYMWDKPVLPAQDPGMAQSATQAHFSEINRVVSAFSEFYMLSKASMSRAIASYEEDVAEGIEEQDQLTVGGALLAALPAARERMRIMQTNAEINAELKGATKTNATDTDPTVTGKKRSAEKVENENANLKRENANLKRGKGAGGKGSLLTPTCQS